VLLPPPSVPSVDAAIASIKTLGITIGNAGLGSSTNLVYTGVDGYYVIYNIQNQKVAVNLISKNACLFSDLNIYVTPTQYQQNKNITTQSKSGFTPLTGGSGYGYLPLFVYNSGPTSWCGPCSGTSIGAYYRDYEGYTGLPDNLDMYNYLCNSMHLLFGATSPGWYGKGFINMTNNYGYSNFSYANDYFVTGGDYWTVVSNIIAGYPTALEITSEFHWRAIKGFSYGPGSLNYIICTNSENSDNWQYLNWDSMGWGLFTCEIQN
jgi:hypothetical protein